MAVEGRIAGNQTLLEKNTSFLKQFVERLGEVEFVQKVEVQGKKATCVIKTK
jgi:translation initiation factor IF-3